MKKLVLVLLAIWITISVLSQSINDLALSYAKEIFGTDNLFIDKIVKNSQNEQWPIVFTYFNETCFYYQWSIELDYQPVMISNHSIQEARDKTEYYVFNEHQELIYYLLKYGDVEVSVKYENEKSEFLKNYNIDLLDEWSYFIDVTTYFNFDIATKRMNLLIANLSVMWDYPSFPTEVQKIDEFCQNINAYSLLETKTVENAKGYYKDGNLVKIVWNQDILREYYLDNGKLVFVHYPKNEINSDVKMYLFNSKVFRVKVNGEYISKSDPFFFENIYMLPMQIEELLWQFSK
ncbi:MAG TPA: hypothetical protein PLL66_02750 [Bacteroidales bacterium]|mgnify:CR=1 FL=1|nr:hypothetical protein [Bacteroidales bacterium]